MTTHAPQDSLEPGGMTLEQWGALDEDEPGELVDGRLVEEEVTSFAHAVVVGWLIQILGTWCAPLEPERRLLEVFELGSDGRYVVALSASEGAHQAPGCEGLIVDLDDLWRALDALPEGGD